ncbi:MAG: hypothetical protein ACI9W4_000362 [Rhodothermales bacterium]|jgi:hypothetical protein
MPLITGVVVVLLFSVAWPIPIRSVNSLLCFGVIVGGFVAGMAEAKANGNKLESTRGLVLGMKVGVTAAMVVILVDLLFEYADFGQGDRAGVDVLDPIPKYIYAAIYGIWDGLLNLASRDDGPDGLEWPGRIARYIILLASTSLFGGFGGGVAASTVESPSIENLPEESPATPLTLGWMRSGPAIVQLQGPQEAQIFQPPQTARPAAAATGTYGPTDPRWIQAAGQQLRRPSRPPQQAARPAPIAQVPQYAAPAEAVQTPRQGWAPETIYTPQPYFDEAAQMQDRRRPGGSVVLESNPAAPVESGSADSS